jgi:formylglycine-generating enzyme required for sulfatase activity
MIADLYNESVDLLMLRWNQQIGDRALLDQLAIPGLKLPDLREALEQLAFKVHQQNLNRGEANSPDTATADIGEDRLVRAFRPLLNDSRNLAAVVVEYIEKRAGLLIGQGDKDGERQFTFPHRTFQEFLAACHLAAQEDFPAACVRLAGTDPSQWQVVLPLAARVARVERGASAADELVGGVEVEAFHKERRPTQADWACARLGGMMLAEIGVSAIRARKRTRAIAERVARWISASLPVHPDDGGMSARMRAEAGDLLARFDDPRFDKERFYLPSDDLLGFVRIAADPQFRIGTRRADRERIAKIVGNEVDNEINDALTPTSEFYISRYPVTVAQFRAFVEASAFAVSDADALRDPDNRPVRRVDWYEALAYCDWLTQTLATAPSLGDSEIAQLVRGAGRRVALPSDLEWEKAARGGWSDAVFSWGDNRDPNLANYVDTEIGDTSVAGCFPPNGFGLSDMIGNVWEWTRSAMLPYLYDPNDERRGAVEAYNALRVARGGSWRNHPVVVRCGYRDWNQPNLRSDDLGFRLVLRSAPVA